MENMKVAANVVEEQRWVPMHPNDVVVQGVKEDEIQQRVSGLCVQDEKASKPLKLIQNEEMLQVNQEEEVEQLIQQWVPMQVENQVENENEAVIRKNTLPSETWLKILSKLETFELWQRYEANLETIYLAAMNLAEVFQWDVQYYARELTREEFKMLWSYSINHNTREIIFTTQPRQVQILDLTYAKNIIVINLKNVELHRFNFEVTKLTTLQLDNVLLGDGFSLNEILQNNPKLNEVNFKNLENQRVIINNKNWKKAEIKKLHLNKVFAFDILNIIEIQASNLTHLSILNNNISADDLYELDECYFSRLEILKISIYGNKCGNAAMRFLDNVTRLYIETESINTLMNKLKLFFNININKLQRIEIKPININQTFRNECDTWLSCNKRMKLANHLIKYGIDPKQMIRNLKTRNRFIINI